MCGSVEFDVVGFGGGCVVVLVWFLIEFICDSYLLGDFGWGILFKLFGCIVYVKEVILVDIGIRFFGGWV